MAEFERAGGVGEGSFAGRDVKFDTADISGFSAAEIRSLPEGLSSMPVDIQRHIQRFNELGSGGAEIPDTDVLQANKKALSDLGGEISKQISEADGFGTLDPKSVQPLFDKLNELNEELSADACITLY